MTTNLRQNCDTWSRITGRQDISDSKYSLTSASKPAEFGDREIEMYMLRPDHPPADLQALYDAIRHQMTVDGCA